MKQAFSPLHKRNIARAWQQENTFIQAFRSVTGCQTGMCNRGIRQKGTWFKIRFFKRNTYIYKLMRINDGRGNRTVKSIL